MQGEGGITAIKTKLGWVLSGSVHELTHEASSVNTLATHSLRIDANPPEKDMNEKLKLFWQLGSKKIRTLFMRNLSMEFIQIWKV